MELNSGLVSGYNRKKASKGGCGNKKHYLCSYNLIHY
jgi:hypothetical protein